MTLRDIYGNDDKPIVLNNEPVGNAGGLGNFHTVNPEVREPNNTPKIIGGLAVALMLGAAGAYIYSVSGSQPAKQQVVASNTLPAPSAPAPAAAPAPMPAPDSNQAANTPAPEATPAPAADTKPVSKPVPVRSASINKPARMSNAPDTGAANARMQADSQPATQPQQQAAVTPVEPVSPQAPASSLAAAQPDPQQAQSSTPQADTAAPAQDQQTGATPAPAAPAADPAPTPAQ